MLHAVFKAASLRRSRSLCRRIDDDSNEGDDGNGDLLPPLLCDIGTFCDQFESLPLGVGGGHFNFVTFLTGSRLFRFDALFSGRRRASRSTSVGVLACGDDVRAVVGEVDAGDAFLVGGGCDGAAELALFDGDGVVGFASLDKSVGCWSFFGSIFDGDLVACISAAVRGAK